MNRRIVIVGVILVLALATSLWLLTGGEDRRSLGEGAKPASREDASARSESHDTASESGATAQGTALIRGRVVSRGRPVLGAELSVLLLDPPKSGEPAVFTSTISSDRDGRFHLEVPAGRVRVLAEAPGYSIAESRELFVRGGERIEDLVLELQRECQLLVSVVDEDGQAILGASVEVFGLSSWQSEPQKTDEQGRAEFDQLEPGEIRVRARAEGYATVEPDPITVEVGERGELSVVLPRLLGLAGRVVDGASQPKPGARVVARSDTGKESSVISGKDGTFRFESLASGSYAIFATHPRSAPSDEQVVSTGTLDVEIVLNAGGRARGRVEAPSGEPEPSFHVVVESFTPTDGHPITGRAFSAFPFKDPDGRFEIPDLAPGTYTFGAESKRYGRGRASGIVINRDVLTDGVVIRLKEGGSIAGTVSGVGQGPLEAALVRVSDTQLSDAQLPPRDARTDADGQFLIEGLTEGRRNLTVSKIGYVTKMVAGVQVRSGESTEVQIDMVPLAPGQKPHTEFYGIGAVLSQEDNGSLMIQKIMDGAPSERYGLMPGDRIMSVDGEDATQLGMGRAVELIRGEEGVPVDLDILRPGDPYPFRVRIERGRVVYESR